MGVTLLQTEITVKVSLNKDSGVLNFLVVFFSFKSEHAPSFLHSSIIISLIS